MKFCPDITRQVKSIITLIVRGVQGVMGCSARDKRCFYRVRRNLAFDHPPPLLTKYLRGRGECSQARRYCIQLNKFLNRKRNSNSSTVLIILRKPWPNKDDSWWRIGKVMSKNVKLISNRLSKMYLQRRELLLTEEIIWVQTLALIWL